MNHVKSILVTFFLCPLFMHKFFSGIPEIYQAAKTNNLTVYLFTITFWLFLFVLATITWLKNTHISQLPEFEKKNLNKIKINAYSRTSIIQYSCDQTLCRIVKTSR